MASKFLYSNLFIAAALFLSSCRPGAPQISAVTDIGDNSIPGQIVARIGSQSISLQQIDSQIALPLYDLQRAQYDLRALQLKSEINRLNQEDELVEIYFQPPIPPRIDLKTTDRPPLGAEEAPIEIVIFCSFQSVHCVRLTPALSELQSNYGKLIKFRSFDYPQNFHRNGRPAADASRCAAEQNAYWPYFFALLGFANDLQSARFNSIAQQLNLDAESFSDCMNAQRYRKNIEADVALARELGLSNVPVVFINGLYVRGPQPTAEYRHWIDMELERLDITLNKSGSPKAIPLTSLPLLLIATSKSSDPEFSRAIIAVSDEAATNFQIGDTLSDGVRLKEIDIEFVLIENSGQIEKLPLKGDINDDNTDEREFVNPEDEKEVSWLAGGDNELKSDISERSNAEQLNNAQQKLIPPTGKIPLSRTWLDSQLEEKEKLESHFKAAEHVMEGYNLLRLEELQENKFFSTLGLQDQDVILRVNENWLHSGQMPLWDSLENQSTVSVYLMRNGLPIHYQYNIQ